ncbi:MAG: NGG1p interacting factor NIF3, partial [Nitrospirales bacterium]|nr:NGG1p interacting factor NIF3 [Nitrospirales bacterium]
MRLSDFYKKAIQVGMANDPRGGEILSRELEKRKAEFDEMKPNDKELFDQESLENPYADSRILHGSGEEEVKTLLLGVDIEVGEILMAEALRKRGATVDLVLAHHPEGSAYANLHAVMYMQADILNKFGVPINIAEDLMEGRVREVQRRLMPVNHTRAVDAARLMDIPFACFHTPADNMVVTHLQRLFDEKKPYTIDDVMGLLKEIPEYRDAAKNGAGPTILLGSKNRKAGKV